MASLPRPGCLVRSTLALLGVLFVPFGIWFLRDDKHRYVTQSVALFIGALVCVRYEFSFDLNSMEEFPFIWRYQVDIPGTLDEVMGPVEKYIINRINSTDYWDGNVEDIDPEVRILLQLSIHILFLSL